MEVSWDSLHLEIQACQRCPLCRGIHRKVPGQGDGSANLMFIGEGPGADEDIQGLAFVGAAGQLLSKMIAAIGMIREQVYICNVVKCRPPGNRTPSQEEMLMCGGFLEAQLLLLRPRIVVCLGNTPLKWLLKTTEGITALRGRWFDWRGIQLFPMFHPSYLLRNDSRAKGSPKDLTWQDVQQLKARLDEIGKREEN
jgi:DNA polymerase